MSIRQFLKRISGWKLPAIAILGMLFAAISVMGRGTAPAATPLVMPPQSPFANQLSGIGVIEPNSETIAIGTDLAGLVENVAVKVGQDVALGDALFTLDTRDTKALIAVLLAAKDAAAAIAADAKSQYDIIASVRDARAIAQDELNRRKYAAELATAQFAKAEAELLRAQTTLARQTVRAPVAGQILSIDIRVGEFAAAGNTALPLMRIGNVTPLHVRVEIDEEFSARFLKANNLAKGFLRGDTEKAWPLTFVQAEPYVRPKQNLAVSGQRVDTRVMQLIYALPADAKNLNVGQQMDVFIEAE